MAKEVVRQLSVKQAAAMFCPPVSHDTAWRWMRQGLMLNGRIVKLEATRLGSRWMTTEEAIAKFLQECQETIK